MPCPACGGKGHVILEKCPDCGGSGRKREKRVLVVHIPAGISDGQVVRVRNEGEPSRTGTTRGDLHVYIRTKPHPLLSRRGNDLVSQVPVAFAAAALGGKVTIPTLTGPEEIDIPSGSQNGQVITLKRRGLPSVGGGRRGNQHVQIYIEVPKKLTKKQRELLEVYAETENDNITPQRRSFMESLKEYSKDRKQK